MHFERQHLECPCGESSDAYSENEDGSGKCFSCGKFFPNRELDIKIERKTENMGNDNHAASEHRDRKVTYQQVPDGTRGIKQKVFDFYKTRAAVDENNELAWLSFPHPNGRVLNKSPDKKFWWTGEKKTEENFLFGQDKFPANSAPAVTITEGYLDAMAVYQMFGQKFPAIAITSAQSAKKECSDAYDYLNSFPKIYICFDSDKPGQDAAKEVAKLFDFNKVYVVQMTRKDANEYLEAKDEEAFKKAWFSSRRFLPEGVLSSFADFDGIIDSDIKKPSVPYPFTRLQEMTYGIRTGEVVLFTAQEGIGKTEIFRAMEYSLLKGTDENVGIIHLEENKARTLKGLVGYEIKRPVHLPDFEIGKDELKKVYRDVLKRDDRLHIYSHFGSADPDDILSVVRFLAGACNCKRIFLDHITMVVTGLAGDDERRALDYISTRLAMMVEELDFTLFMISHVNDEGQTRGSRNIGKVADLRIDMNRNITAEDKEVRNTTFLTCSKNRFAGKTGPCGKLFFDHDTFCLSEVEETQDVPF